MQHMLPANIEAECSVLGSVLIDPDAIVHIVDFLQADDFYRDAHRLIYEAVLSLYRQRVPTDFVMLTDELMRTKQLEAIGGASYVSELVNSVPTSANILYYARIVERSSVLRRLIHAAGDMAALAYDASDEQVDAVLVQAEEMLFAVRRSHRSGHKKSPLVRDGLGDFMERLEQLEQRRGEVSGLPTGFAGLDQLLGGFQASDLIVLAARPSVGKSALALSLAHNAAVRYQKRIGIFSLEMSKEQMVQRLIAMDARIDQQRLRSGYLEDDDWERIIEAMGTLATAELLIDDTANISPQQLRSRVRQWVVEYGELDLIIVDYLQFMHPDGGAQKRNDTRVQIVDEFASELKTLAREMNIPVLALAQLSRAVEQRHSRVPMLSDLRESGAIEQTADVVMFIYRDDMYNPESERKNQAEIIVAKHRNGPVGETTLYFERSQTRFRDLEMASGSSLGEGRIVDAVRPER